MTGILPCSRTFLRFVKASIGVELKLLYLVKSSTMIRWIAIFVIFTGAVCEGKHSTQCDNDKFPCNDGSCVYKSMWCDSSEDCEDGSDEMYCFLRSASRPNPNRCNGNFFLCKDGRCIPIVGHCDGYNSCNDNSDEEDCNTTSINSTLHKFDSFDLEASTLIEAEAREFKVAASGKINHTKAVKVSNHDHTQSSFSSTQRTIQENEALKKFKNVSDTLGSLNVSKDNWEAKMKKYSDFVTELTSRNTSQTNKESNHTDDRREIATPIAHNSSQTEDALRDEARQSNAHKKEDLEQEFIELDERDFFKERSRVQNWLLNDRDENYGWGDETARATVALYMSDSKFTKRQHGRRAEQTNEQMLMTKDLSLKIFTALVRNQTKTISLEELALFINALSASCENPRNFHGTDLVTVLRQRANLARNSTGVSPFVYLVLCLNNATDSQDIEKMKQSVRNMHQKRKIDIDAVASLASTCISKNPQSAGYQIGKQMAELLCFRVSHEGLPDSLYDLALVAQALNEARVNQDRWNRLGVMHRIREAQKDDGSFGDILSTYYVVPLLSGKSLLSINAHCEPNEEKGLVPIEVLKNGEDKKKYIHYTLYYEDPPEMTQTLMIKVKNSCSVLDIMRVAASLNPAYKFEYIESKGKPYVYSVGGVVNDAEKGLYWKLFLSSPGKAPDSLVSFEGDIRSLVPEDGQVLVFWRKSAF